MLKVYLSDGTGEWTPETYTEAIEMIAERYEMEIDDLEYEDCEACGSQPERRLVWLSAAEARNDDGSNAVAEIVAADYIYPDPD